MKMVKRTIAITELLFIVPAALFMIALFMREVQPLMQTGYLIDWFSQHTFFGLYIFLIAFPVSALIIGGISLFRIWQNDTELRQTALKLFSTLKANLAMLLISMVTLISVIILIIVALHMITE